MMRHIIPMQRHHFTNMTYKLLRNNYTIISDRQNKSNNKSKAFLTKTCHMLYIHYPTLGNNIKTKNIKMYQRCKFSKYVSLLKSGLTCAELYNQHCNSSEDGPCSGHCRHESSVHVSYCRRNCCFALNQGEFPHMQ